MKAAELLDDLRRRFPNEPEYLQAVEEVVTSIEDVYNEYPEFERYNLIERLCIPDRVFAFRVSWVDDKGRVRNNMGYRIQHNNAIGPYKGGIRFHSSVTFFATGATNWAIVPVPLYRSYTILSPAAPPSVAASEEIYSVINSLAVRYKSSAPRLLV